MRGLLFSIARDLGRPAEARDITTEAIQAWLRTLRGRGGKEAAAATVVRSARAVRSLARILVLRQLLPADPTEGLILPDIPDRLPRPMPEKVCRALLRAPLERTDPWAPRMRYRDSAALELLYCALREDEVSRLDHDHLTWNSPSWGDVTLRVRGKRNQPGDVVVSRSASVALRRYVAQQKRLGHTSGPLFRSQKGGRLSPVAVGHIARRYFRQLGIVGWRPHDWRHSCATHLLDHGAQLTAVQTYLRHKSLASTRIYAKITTKTQKREAMRHHPRSRGVPDLWSRPSLNRHDRMR